LPSFLYYLSFVVRRIFLCLPLPISRALMTLHCDLRMLGKFITPPRASLLPPPPSPHCLFVCSFHNRYGPLSPTSSERFTLTRFASAGLYSLSFLPQSPPSFSFSSFYFPASAAFAPLLLGSLSAFPNQLFFPPFSVGIIFSPLNVELGNI